MHSHRYSAVRFMLASLLAATVLSGCAGKRPDTSAKQVVITPTSLASNLQVIETIEPELEALDAEFRAFPRPASEGRDYFDAEEVDAMEGLLFRFHALQTSLWDIVDAYGGLDAKFADDANATRAEVLALVSTLLIASHTALIVEQFADDPVAIKQMNEAYYRSEIPFGSYDRMRESVTSPGLLDAVADAKDAYGAAMTHPESPLVELAQMDIEYAALIAQLPTLHDEAEQRLRQVAKYFPSYAEAEKLAKKDAREQHKVLYAMRSFVFKVVSRLKNPTAHVLEFSDSQKEEIFSLLEPGDLVLTYTAGYMSDVFIPGAFKHGITYIGRQEERDALDLSVDDLPRGDRFEPEKFSANLQQTTLPSGASVNMIEAVAEGVIFNNLEHIMDTHINRMLVLRPRLSAEERVAFLAEVYSYLGDGYDFRFDFADATQQVCTEVIYRAIDGKGGIEFELTERAGHETLSADDIANYHLISAGEVFDFVLLVEPDTGGKKNSAIILTGAEGEKRLETLMASVSAKEK
jgi:hypothetical protein